MVLHGHRRPRRCLVIVLSVVISALTGCTSKPPSFIPAENAALYTASVRQDLGVMAPGQEKFLTFMLRNDGRVPLEIQNLRTSCGCAPARITTNPIPPLEDAEILVSYRAPSYSGPNQHSILFETNDPNNRSVRLSFQAMIKRSIDVTPAVIYAGVVSAAAISHYDLELCSLDAQPFDVTSVESTSPFIRVESVAALAPYRRLFRISVEGNSTRCGTFSEEVLFSTTCLAQPSITVPIRGEIVAGIQAFPSRLLLKPTPAGSVAEASVVFASMDGESVDISRIIIDDDQQWYLVSFSIEPNSTSNKSVVRLRIRVPGHQGYRRTELRFLGISEKLIHKLPLSCVVQASRE